MSDRDSRSKKIVILQPGYLPWAGFFDLLFNADIFVAFDDAQYTIRDWRNRNRIKTPHGLMWLTVPVKANGLRKKKIKDVEIDNSHLWQKKQLKGLERFYRKSKYYDESMEVVTAILNRSYKYLIDVDMEFIFSMLEHFAFERKIVFSSDLAPKGKKDEKLLALCKLLNATHYLSGDAATKYLRESIFHEEGIKTEWHNYHHPYYNQLWLKEQGFISHLSIVDLLMNHGRESLDILTGKTVISPPEGLRIRHANDV